MLTVGGYVYLWDNAGNIRPASWTTAWVFDVDLDGVGFPSTTTIWTTLVEDNGSFAAGPFCNRDGTDAGTRDIIVAVVALSTAAQVLRYQIQGDPWALVNPASEWQFAPLLYSAWIPHDPIRDNVADGTLDIGRWIVPHGSTAKYAFMSYSPWSGVLIGWDLLRNRVSSPMTVQQVELHYRSPYNPDEWICPHLGGCRTEDFPHYHVVGSACAWSPWTSGFPRRDHCPYHWDDFWWQIHIDSPASASSPFVVNHLYAHYVTQKKFGAPLYPSNGATEESSSRFAGDADVNAACSGTTPSYQLYCNLRLTADYASHDSTHAKGIAWAEGFADAFALRALATRPGGSETSIFSFQRATGTPWSFDFESKPASSTYQVEHSVAASLWDIHDTWLDGADNYGGGFNRVWQAFGYQYATTLQAFWNAWWGKFHLEHTPGASNSPISGAQLSLRQNIAFPTAVSLAQPDPYEIGSDSVTLRWTQNTDSNFNRYEVHRSTNRGFTPGTTTFVNDFYEQYTTAYNVYGLSAGTTYYFEVVVFDQNQWKAGSNKVSARTDDPPPPPPPPPPPGGCPFVAPWNGTGYVLDNNILAASEALHRESLVVCDSYRLHQPLIPKDGRYSLKIVESEEEHTRLDRVRLLVVDHDRDARVAVTAAGDLLTFEDPEPPESAVDNYDRDVRSLLAAQDGQFYEGWRGDFVDVTFGRVREPNARLLLKADEGHNKQSIDAFVLQDGNWSYAGTVHPRFHFAWDVIDLSGFVPSRNLVLRLVATQPHKLDLLGLDTSLQHALQVREADLLSAIHSEVGDVRSPLSDRDEEFVEITPGQEVVIEFDIPATRGDVRSFVLLSCGYYTAKYQKYVGEDLRIDGLDIVAKAFLPDSTEFFWWEVNITALTWDFGDGSIAEGFEVSHAYAEPSERVITVQVAHADGTTKIYVRRIVIQG